MVLKWTRTKPEPLKYFEQELNLNPNRYLKRFDTLEIIALNALQVLPNFVQVWPHWSFFDVNFVVFYDVTNMF